MWGLNDKKLKYFAQLPCLTRCRRSLPVGGKGRARMSSTQQHAIYTLAACVSTPDREICQIGVVLFSTALPENF